MTFRRRNEFSAAVLVVYLSAIISGGLHHHDAVRAANLEPSSAVEGKSQVTSRLASAHEDADDCTICIALHQAKAPPAVISLAEAFVFIDEAAVLPIKSPIAFVPHVKQARAPPTL